jgi:hypothetical protein
LGAAALALHKREAVVSASFKGGSRRPLAMINFHS